MTIGALCCDTGVGEADHDEDDAYPSCDARMIPAPFLLYLGRGADPLVIKTSRGRAAFCAMQSALHDARVSLLEKPVRADDWIEGFVPAVAICADESVHVAPDLDLDGPLWLVDDRAGGVRDDGRHLVPPAVGFWE